MKNSFFFVFVFCAVFAFGQSDVDVFRYSFLQPGGTARTMALGGAFGAIGADFSTLSSNPAGIGVYRSSSLMFSPSLNFTNASSTFAGTNTSKLRVRPNVFNIGVVFANKRNKKHVRSNEDQVIISKWKGVNFGMGFNRLANFNRKVSFEGTSRGTITERYVQAANGLTPNQLNAFDTGLAFDAGLIYNSDLTPTVYEADLGPNDEVFKSHTLESKGGIDELVISLGTNYEYKLYLGATIGVQFVNYEEETAYRENDLQGVDSVFNNLLIENEFVTSGLGANVKIGAIYRINKQFRAGLAFHSPTNLSLTDTFSSYLETTLNYPDINVPATYTEEPPNTGVYEYRVVSPMRAILSGAYFIPKKGFLSVEAEWVNYGSARLRLPEADDNYEATVNTEVKRKYGQAINLRAGAEYAFEKYRARLGYAYYMSPFKVDVPEINSAKQQISGGFGYNSKKYFIDLAYIIETRSELYLPYSPESSPNNQIASNNFTRHNVVLTAGFKFNTD